MLDKFFGYPALEFAVSEGIKGAIARVVRKGSTLGNTNRVTTGNCARAEQNVRYVRAVFGGGLFDKGVP
jgi:hypothetical protein